MKKTHGSKKITLNKETLRRLQGLHHHGMGLPGRLLTCAGRILYAEQEAPEGA